MSDNSNPIRFASLIRVSTEKQEKQGESLNIQRKANERDVARIGGRIVERYGGQEHGTAGYERAEVDRLIADAAKNKFDAVIVAYPDRWSRDNAKSKAGLEAFRQSGIRFFVGATEKHLFDPNVVLELGIQAELGEFYALQQRKKSLEAKIERARQGRPPLGKHQWPFGRRYNKEAAEWQIIPEDYAKIQDIAKRFLGGESLLNLAAEYHTSYTALCKNLRHRCGDEWEVTFSDRKLNVFEKVKMVVPRLLDDKTIKAVCQRLDACRTYLHKSPRQKHDYLLRNFVFCSGCGRAYTGSVHSDTGVHYYRHAHRTKALVRKEEEPCPYRSLGQQHIRAKQLEQAVVVELFNLMGNPAAIERAINNAVPDVSEARTKQERLSAELNKIAKARDKILNLIAGDFVKESEAKKTLNDLKDRQALLKEEQGKVDEELANVPTEESIRCYLNTIEDLIDVNGKRGRAIWIEDDEGNEIVGGNSIGSFLIMTRQDKRHLIECAFSTPLPGGKPAGVSLTPDGKGGHTYQVHGHLNYAIQGRIRRMQSSPCYRHGKRRKP